MSPLSLIERAAARGVRALALTDHDTLDGVDDAATAAGRHAIEFVPGVEISVSWSGRTLHVLGLGVDPAAAALDAGLRELRSGRIRRGQAIGARLEQLGVPRAFDAAMALAANHEILGRAHFARHMVASGLVKDLSSAFRRYLGEGKPAYVRHTWAELAQAVGWIKAAGGIAVLAHPGRYGMRPPRLRTLLGEFRAAGGVGIEVVCASHSAEQVQLVSRLAAESGLLASAGSDFHSVEESWLDLGDLPPLPTVNQPVWQHPRLQRLAMLQ